MSGATLYIAIAVAVVIVLALIVFWLRKRRAGGIIAGSKGAS